MVVHRLALVDNLLNVVGEQVKEQVTERVFLEQFNALAVVFGNFVPFICVFVNF